MRAVANFIHLVRIVQARIGFHVGRIAVTAMAGIWAADLFADVVEPRGMVSIF